MYFKSIIFFIFSGLFLFCQKGSSQTIGIFHNSSGALNGYTLFSPIDYTSTYLINNCGDLVKEWTSDYSPALSVYLDKNLNLVKTGKLNESNFQRSGKGGIIEIKDWQDNLIYQTIIADTTYIPHHDIALLPNGNILLILWEMKTKEEAISAGRDPEQINSEIWPSMIWEIELIFPDTFNVVWEWHLWDHLIQDFDNEKQNYGTIEQHPELININHLTAHDRDWIHLNSIDYNEERDEILLSSRAFNEIWIIDHSTTTEEAEGHLGGNSGKGGDILYRWGNPETYGQGTQADKRLFGQHDASWKNIEKDKIVISLFNNHHNSSNNSCIADITIPISVNGYELSKDSTYFPDAFSYEFCDETIIEKSEILSGAQTLENGNRLICSGAKGIFVEIDPSGMAVWKYKSPVSLFGPEPQGTNINSRVFKIQKWSAEDPLFEDVNLMNLGPIELNPLKDNCEIYNNPVSAKYIENKALNIYPNPFSTSLHFEPNSDVHLSVSIYNLNGHVVYSGSLESDMITESWASGIYILRVFNSNLDTVHLSKIIKQ